MSQLSDSSLNGDGNLLANYKFNTGALTTDSSAGARTLTDNGTVGETSSGRYGYAADFGDPNTTKYFSRTEDLWANGAISFVAWVKRSNTTDTHSFFMCSEATTMKQLFLSAISSNELRARIYRVGVGYDEVDTTSVSWDTNWHHVALTLTTGAGGTMKIYFDGVEKNSGSVTNSSGSVGQSDQYWVGRSSDDGYHEQYMDDVAFFSDVLTGTEILELYSGPSASPSLSPSSSVSASASRSLSPSASVSASASRSASASLSPSSSASRSASASASASESKSASASESKSMSPSASESKSLSPSSSQSRSMSPSASISPSASVSPSISPSASLSPANYQDFYNTSANSYQDKYEDRGSINID